MLLKLRLLGGFQAEIQGHPLRLRTDKMRALLAYLALHRDQEHPRARLAYLCWPDFSDTKALDNLRLSLTRLRQPIAAVNAELDRQLFTILRQFVRLNSGAQTPLLWCDVSEFRALLHACNNHDHPAITACSDCFTRLAAAADLYQGDLLAGLYLPDSEPFESWVLLEREMLHQQAVTLLDTLMESCRLAQRYGEMADYARRSLLLEAWRESTHRQLMQALAAAGHWEAALRQYERCREVLASELALEPSAETTALFQTIVNRAVAGAAPGQQAMKVERVSGAEPASQSLPTALANVPSVEALYGRTVERERLAGWVLGNQHRVVAIVGMGGIGKTTLAAALVRQWGAERFAHSFWHSLVNAPPLADLLQEWLQILSGQEAPRQPNKLDQQLTNLLAYLQHQRCLLVLDNLESILETGEGQGRFRAGYEGYGQLLQRLAEVPHSSCLLITTREEPQILARLARSRPQIGILPLAGLSATDGKTFLSRWALQGNTAELQQVVARYSGNPLALELVAETIDELYAGSVAAFLREPAAVFQDIEDVLEEQFNRLSPLEASLMYWLAIERSPVALEQLDRDMLGAERPQDLLNALHRLKRRFLVEQQFDDDHNAFYLQNVVIEYVTERLIQTVYQEIVTWQPHLLTTHALLKARAEEYVRQSQTQVVIQPVGKRLIGYWGQENLFARIQQLFDQLRTQALTTGYAPGNLVNLLLQTGIPVRGLDLSGLTVRQAALQNAWLYDVNLRDATLVDCTFTETFSRLIANAFSPDGQLLAAGSDTGNIHLWRLSDGQQIAQIASGDAFIWSVAFSPDGRLLASGGTSGLIRLWDLSRLDAVAYRTPLQILAGHSDSVRSVAFSPDGQELASGSEDWSVRLWALADPRLPNGVHLRKMVNGHTDRVFRVVYSQDGRYLASAGADQQIRIWDRQRDENQWNLAGHSERIAALAFGVDSATLISGGVDTQIRLWNLNTGRCCQVLDQHREAVLTVAVSPDGSTLASAGHNGAIRLWRNEGDHGYHPTQILSGHQQPIWSVAFHPGGKVLTSSGDDLELRLWDSERGHCISALRSWRVINYCVDFDSTGRQLVVGSGDGRLRVWDVSRPGSSQLLTELQAHSGALRNLCYSHTHLLLATGSEDGTVQLWKQCEPIESTPLVLLHRLPAIDYGVSQIAVSPDGQWLGVGSQRNLFFLWRLPDLLAGKRQPLHTIAAHKHGLWSLAFSPDSRLIASGGDDHVIRLWDIDSGACVREIGRVQGLIESLAFSPDGAHLIMGSQDDLIARWQVRTGDLIEQFEAQQQGVICLQYVNARRTLVSSGMDSSICLWPLNKDQARTNVQRLSGHTARINMLAQSADGQLLASASYDGTARLWSLPSGDCLEVLPTPGPYTGMNITGVKGLSESQKYNLQALGAIDLL